MVKTTAISFEGDNNYRLALKLIAKNKSITVAKLVREALDSHLGSELKTKAIFFATIDQRIDQMVNDLTDKDSL